MTLHRTLGDMRAELQTRLGFGMSGQAGIVNSPIMDSFLRSAQDQLYQQFEWRNLFGFEERLTGVGQSLYDYPDGCDVEQITSVSILISGVYQPLTEGISLAERSCPASPWPLKYERFEQMEIWPVPTTRVTLRREFVKSLAPFTDSNNRSSIPSELVFLMALTNAKAHYRQPDADRYQTQLDQLLNKLKAKHRGKSVWTSREMDSRMAKDRFYDYPRT
ncbi:MAG: hypothetical protein EOO79_08055 [Oxalobacteraceae bacterium]|nr:MAG: hypothetical protein EOO79_08055 [Oxalobacteraceae bacterium]